MPEIDSNDFIRILNLVREALTSDIPQLPNEPETFVLPHSVNHVGEILSESFVREWIQDYFLSHESTEAFSLSIKLVDALNRIKNFAPVTKPDHKNTETWWQELLGEHYECQLLAYTKLAEAEKLLNLPDGFYTELPQQAGETDIDFYKRKLSLGIYRDKGAVPLWPYVDQEIATFLGEKKGKNKTPESARNGAVIRFLCEVLPTEHQADYAGIRDLLSVAGINTTRQNVGRIVKESKR